MHTPPRILIVDDNETNRDILRTRLGPQGYDMLEAADGEQAAPYRIALSKLLRAGDSTGYGRQTPMPMSFSSQSQPTCSASTTPRASACIARRHQGMQWVSQSNES